MPKNFYDLLNRRNKVNTVVVEPVNGITTPKNLDDWRALFHDLVPVVVSTLVGINLVTNDQVTPWIPFIFAIVDPLLSAGNAVDKVRKIIYSIVVLLQGSSAIVALVTSDPQIPMVVTAIATIASATFARFNTPTSSMIPKVGAGTAVP